MNIRNRITELRYVDMTMARWEQYTSGKAVCLLGFALAANKRTFIQIEDDRREIASLYLQGKTQQAIAEAP